MQWPVMHVFRKQEGKIFHFWGTESMSNHVERCGRIGTSWTLRPRGVRTPLRPEVQVQVLGKALSQQRRFAHRTTALSGELTNNRAGARNHHRPTGSSRLWLMLFVAWALAFAFFEVVDDVFEDPLEGETDTREFDASISAVLLSVSAPTVSRRSLSISRRWGRSACSRSSRCSHTRLKWRKCDYIGFAHMSVALFGALVWPSVLKAYFERERPDAPCIWSTAGDLSFPSGHSFGAAACYATFAFFCAATSSANRRDALRSLAVGHRGDGRCHAHLSRGALPDRRARRLERGRRVGVLRSGRILAYGTSRSARRPRQGGATPSELAQTRHRGRSDTQS